MEMAFMLLISLLIAASDPLPSPPVTGTACPMTQRGVRLSNNQVIAGPPADGMILRDDGERRIGKTIIATWKVGYVYEKGRQVHLLCEYRGMPSIVIKVDKPVTTCRYTRRGRIESLACR